LFVLAALFASAAFADDVAAAPEPTPAPEPAAAAAPDDDEFEFTEKEVDTDVQQIMPTSLSAYAHPDVKVTAIIPDYMDKAIPAGTAVDVLVWFKNTGDMPFMVKYVHSALLSPVDATRSVQNFTARPADIVVEPHTETTIAYRVHPSEYLPEQPFRFITIVNYMDPQSNHYFNVAFNGTINFTEKKVAFDIELILTYIILLASAAGIVYLIYRCVAKKTSKGSGPKAPRVVNSEEWIYGTVANPRVSAKKTAAHKNGGSKKKN